MKEKSNDIKKLDNSLCKIKNKEKNGYGYLVKLEKEKKSKHFYYLISIGENIIAKSDLESNENKIFLNHNNKNENKEIPLNKNKRFIKEYKFLNIYITIFEILLEEDNINKKYFINSNDFIDLIKIKDIYSKNPNLKESK